MKNIFAIIIAGLLTVLLSSCLTTSFKPSTIDITSTESQKEVLNFQGYGEWKGRSLYSFFEDIYAKGVSPSSLEGEIFVPDTDWWQVEKSTVGFNKISIKIPQLYSYDTMSLQVEGTYGYNKAYQEWDAGFPFPASEAQFVVDSHSDRAYVKGQNFVNYVIYSGYQGGFIQWSGGVTNEIRMHTFHTADGFSDLRNYYNEE